MHANNEVGIVDGQNQRALPVHGAFHSDTVQSMGPIPWTSPLWMWIFDLQCTSFTGPRWISLYSPHATREGLIVGGQERMLRGGTENVAGIVGLTRAFDVAHANMSAHELHIHGLKSRMVAGLRARLPEVVFNGHSDGEDRLYTVLMEVPKASQWWHGGVPSRS